MRKCLPTVAALAVAGSCLLSATPVFGQTTWSLVFLPDSPTTGVRYFAFATTGSAGLITGTVVRPWSDRPLPAIVFNCGVQHYRISNHELTFAERLADDGFVVILPNYSFCAGDYDAGFGRRRLAPEEDPGVCVAVGEFAGRLAFVDGRRVGLAGIGAGGFLVVDVLIEKHPYTAAAVLSAGVRFAPTEPSPLDRINVPVLIQTGLEDTWTPPAYGLNLHKALDSAVTPSRRKVYESAGHDLMTADDGQIVGDLSAWFNEHLVER
jgi:dienelactone hydrolase